MKKFPYNNNVFNFADGLRNIFDVYHLDRINENREILKREEDQSTRYHKLYYGWAKTEKFTRMYESLIQHVIKKHVYNNDSYILVNFSVLAHP